MIPRYSREEMTDIWSADHRFKIWADIEISACDALAELGVIPAQAAENIREKANTKAKWDIDRIDEIEKITRHDILAFLTNMSENIGKDARFLHQGMTSSDVLDTAFAVQLKEASELLIEDLDKVLKVLKVKVEENLSLITIGRSHGIHAEPTSFGLKLATHYAAFSRARRRLLLAKEEVSTCAISGPVGTFATIDPAVEQFVAKRLGLNVEPISTQIIPRDRHAMFFATLGIIACSIEAFAIEMRHLQRSEVREAEEPFAKGQKGSSAMPHKRNPVLAENLTGLARVIRAAVVPAMENVALWHERDISHSSVERIFAPDATIALDFALSRLASLIEGMTIYKERIQENLNALGGLHFSQRLLLALTQKGMSREDAYAKVQSIAMEVWHEIQQGKKVHFKDKIFLDTEITNLLSQAEIDACFNEAFYIQHAKLIWHRVLNADNITK